MKTARLKVPVAPDDLAGLELGTVVYLDGVIYTGREGVYRRALDQGIAPPCDLAALSNVNFHCSPAAAREADGSYTIGAVTATASFRFAKWLEAWFALAKPRIIIGKGGMPEEDYRRHFVPNGAIYLTTVGYGTGALLGRGIARVRAVHWLEELGIAQALWVLEVKDFGPLLVESDLAGKSLFARHKSAIDAQIAKAYEGLPEPALKRYGETGEKDEEVI
jgi:L(+)-tartrate dehydratase beta subunit